MRRSSRLETRRGTIIETCEPGEIPIVLVYVTAL